ncbi:4Fe-4S dicluster domain-containing protein [Aeromonas sp. MdU4]|uniref:4Fe-4S dicluster domain-containing protein n=1 Tax=Aeromonas sp. MdU4 TaxID=3342819 RepID=UPI0035B975AD
MQRKNALATPLPAVARPPQALPEALFNALCSGCGNCERCCPYGLVSIEQGKAALSIEFTECDFCLKCTAACDTGALCNQMTGDTLLRPQISHSCLGHQESCSICVIKCSQQALTFQQSDSGVRQLKCDAQLCNGCGLCKLSCVHGHIVLVPVGEKTLPERPCYESHLHHEAHERADDNQ